MKFAVFSSCRAAVLCAFLISCNSGEGNVPVPFELKNLLTLVISLEGDEMSAKRLSRIAKGLNENHIEMTLIPGVNGYAYKGKYDTRGLGTQHLDVEKGYTYEYTHDVLDRGLSAGELGTYFSHYEAAKRALDNHNGITLVLEDDAVFAQDFEMQLKALLTHAPSDWDAIYLHCFSERKVLCDIDGLPVVNNRFVSLDRGVRRCVPGGLAYILNPKGAAKVLHNMLPARTTADDRMMDELFSQKQGVFKVYCAIPQLAMPDESDSIIDTIQYRYGD